MVCPGCGFENSKEAEFCTSCGCRIQEQKDAFLWSELPQMPVFHTAAGEKQTEQETGRRRRLSRRARRLLWQGAIFTLEACILAGVVTGVFLWKEKQYHPPVNADNIVYSSDDIVMMLVQEKEKWILEKPDNGYNACCFLDLDFDGSPELMSISYNGDNAVTQLNAYRVRSCTLEKIPVDKWKPEETAVFYDAMQQQMSLHYAPDTKEMLYLCSDTKILSAEEGEAYTGCFYLQESRIFQEYYTGRAVSGNQKNYYVYEETENGEKLPSA
ncbi:MAG: zinc ribbon domain-containing protein, partial [Oscillospiraceae bacterium]|nr:zinc ribbon domain-containing protein [Oscillospiraceae bacterium]